MRKKARAQVDVVATRRLKEAGDLLGIRVLDHIIVDTETGNAVPSRHKDLSEGFAADNRPAHTTNKRRQRT